MSFTFHCKGENVMQSNSFCVMFWERFLNVDFDAKHFHVKVVIQYVQ